MRIESSALKTPDGTMWTMSAPADHTAVMDYMLDCGVSPTSVARSTHGYMDSSGRFLRPTEAWDVAIQAGQIVRMVGLPVSGLCPGHMWE